MFWKGITLNTIRLRHSLLALSIAAALHTGSAVADIDYDISSAPLDSNLLNTNGLVDLHGNLNATPVAAPGLTFGAQFKGLSARQLRNNDSIRIDGATHGVGISLGDSGAVKSKIQFALINNGSIAVHGLTGVGTSTGISVINSELGNSLSNTGSIDISGATSTGVMLVQTSLSGVSNSGMISASGTDALGLLLDGATLNSGINNSGTVRATGTNAEALVLEGVRPSGSGKLLLSNSGTISGESIGVHVSGQAAGGSPLSIYQLNGLIEGVKQPFRSMTAKAISISSAAP